MNRSQTSPSRPRIAWAIFTLAVAVGVGVWLAIFVPPPTSVSASAAPGGADLVLYGNIVSRMAAGEGYYPAAYAELQAGGYPVRSVFAWRLPSYAWLFVALGPLTQPVLLALVLLAVGLAATLEARDSGRFQALGVTVLLIGVAAWAVDGEAYLSQELWAGFLILVSVACCGHRRPYLGLVAGAAALFLRELALPFTVVAAWQALRERRTAELGGWLVTWILFFAFHFWHAQQIRMLVDPDAGQAGLDWVQWGGIGFVLRTVQMNQWLSGLPLWVASVYLGLAFLGFSASKPGWRTLAARTAFVYTAAFCVVGKPFNNYWGLLVAPLLPFGVVGGIGEIVTLLTHARLPAAAADRADGSARPVSLATIPE